MSPSGVGAAESFTTRRRHLSATRGWYLNAIAFALTVLSTTAFGFSVVRSYEAGRRIELDAFFDGYQTLYRLEPAFWQGLRFSIPLLLILLAHEFGHYVACQVTRVDASLPYFLPSPFLLGTFGAFIRIRSPIYSRKQLFDIGISGPLAGFLVLLPFLFYGVSLSKPVALRSVEASVALGTPGIMRLAEMLMLKSVPGHLSLHPSAVAAWAGLLATAINLIPMGQLDGGHIVYAMFGERWHRTLSTTLIAALLALGFAYWAWWIWAVAMFFLGRRHPLVYDRRAIGPVRVSLGIVALLMFALSVAVVPVVIR
jgi:membrane-associated protease RseP (regulator of RpoE activity)